MPDQPQLGPLDCTSADEKIVQKLIGLTPDEVSRFLDGVAYKSSTTDLDYIKDDGTRIFIPITPAPAIFSAQQVRELHRAFEALAAAAAKVAAAWLSSAALQRVLPLEPYEADWLRLAGSAPGNPPERMFHRWDFAMNVSADADANNFKLFEVNSVDVGGIHYAAAAYAVSFASLLEIGIKQFTAAGEDSRRVLEAALKDHAVHLGRRLQHVAIAENQDFTTGITEAESLRKFLCKRGIETQCVDARKLNPDSFDVVYRNIELRDLADLETAGGDVSGLRGSPPRQIVVEPLRRTRSQKFVGGAGKRRIRRVAHRRRATDDRPPRALDAPDFRTQDKRCRWQASRFARSCPSQPRNTRHEAQPQLRRPRGHHRLCDITIGMGTRPQRRHPNAEHVDRSGVHPHSTAENLPRE